MTGSGQAALYKLKELFDCSPDVFEQAVAKIASNYNVERRIEELNFWRNSSAPVYYSNLQHQLIKTGRFEPTDLIPPSADGLVRHLRMSLTPSEGESFTSIINDSALSLIRDTGLTTAIERIWSLPVPIPNAILTAVRALSKIERRTLVKTLLKRAATPISKLHLLGLLVPCFEDAPIYRRLARVLIKKLLSSERVPEFEAFKAVLNWVSEEFGNWQQLCALMPRLRLAFVWVHAHKLLTTFLAAGAPNDQIRDKFSRMGSRIPHELFQRDSAYWLDIAHPRQVNRRALVFSGLSYALGKEAKEVFDRDVYDALIADAYETVEKVRIPALPLLKDPTLASNSLRSFLAGNRGETWLCLLGEEHAPAFSRETLVAVTQRSIAKLAEDPNDFTLWGQIFSIVGDMPPYKEITEGLRAILIKTEYSRLFDNDEQLGSYAMLSASTWAISIGDDDVRTYLKEQLIKMFELGSRSQNQLRAKTDSPDSEETAALLLESALNLSRALQLPEDVHREFGELAMRTVDAWPKMAAVFRPVIERVCDELPIAAGRYVYPLLLRLRAC